MKKKKQKKKKKTEIKQNQKAAKDTYTSSKNYAHDPHENVVRNEKPNSLLDKYFSDQEQKRKLKQQQFVTDRIEKITDKLLNRMEKAKLKKRTQRNKISDLQREKILLKDRCRKQLKREKLSSNEKIRFNEKEKQYKKTQRKNLTEQTKIKAKCDDSVKTFKTCTYVIRRESEIQQERKNRIRKSKDKHYQTRQKRKLNQRTV